MGIPSTRQQVGSRLVQQELSVTRNFAFVHLPHFIHFQLLVDMFNLLASKFFKFLIPGFEKTAVCWKAFTPHVSLQGISVYLVFP